MQEDITQIYDDQINNLKSDVENVYLKHDNDMKVFTDNVNTSVIHNQEIMNNDFKNKINEQFARIGKIKDNVEKLEKALHNYSNIRSAISRFFSTSAYFVNGST